MDERHCGKRTVCTEHGPGEPQGQGTHSCAEGELRCHRAGSRWGMKVGRWAWHRVGPHSPLLVKERIMEGKNGWKAILGLAQG